MGEFDDLVGEFVTESREHIADIEDDLIKIEAEMESVDPETINRVFRAAHSIKGSAKFLDLANIGDLAHKLEDVLNLVRSGKLKPTSDVAGPLLQAADMLKTMLEDVTTSNEMDISEHLTQLQDIIDGAGSRASASKPGATASSRSGLLTVFATDGASLLKKLDSTQVYVLNPGPDKEDSFDEFVSELKNLGEIIEIHESRTGSRTILFSTIMEPDMIPAALDIDGNAFTQVRPDMIGQSRNADRQQAGGASRPEPKPQPEAESVKKPLKERYVEDHDSGFAPEESQDSRAGALKENILPRGKEEKRKEEDTSFITFSLENETYAVPIRAIEEIIGHQDISLLPNVPSFIKGVINLRGELVPIMDLRLKFGLEPLPYNPLTVFLIVRVEDRVMGLVVDNVADVLNIDTSRIQKTPVFSAKISTDFIEGVYKDTQDQMVILVNVAALTKPEEWTKAA